MNNTLNSILRHPVTVPAAASVVAGVIGFGAGYFVAKRRQQSEFVSFTSFIDQPEDGNSEDDIQWEIAEVDEIIEEQGYSPADMGEDFVRSIVTNPRRNPEEIVVEDNEPELVTSNIFADNEVHGWDYERELSARSDDEPYILHQDEYHANEMGLTQVTLTYYEGDDKMVDDSNQPIYDYEKVVGTLQFGHGCTDPDVVFVRNEKLEGEYEILRELGFYAVEVLGAEIEDQIEAADYKRAKHHIPKMRDE